MSKRKKGTTRSKMITWCPECEHDVGVTQDFYNRTRDRTTWRMTTHQGCSFSRSIVHPNNVFPNKIFEVAQ